MYKLEFSNITKNYDFQVLALDSVSFGIKSGEIVGLLGTNGAGKTTSIKICTRLLGQYEGNVLLDGADINTIPLAKYPISYVPDEPVFYEFMSLSEHLTFVQSLYENTTEFTKDLLISEFDLEEHLNKKPHQLSKGTKQKLMIAMALLREYSIFIADEPFTGLDPYQISVLKKTLIGLRDSGKSVLVSTHLLDMVESFCDRYVLLHKGKVLSTGSRLELARKIGEKENVSLETIFLKYVQKELGDESWDFYSETN
jgi:ABC-2 type transport system ATP-binding protein